MVIGMPPWHGVGLPDIGEDREGFCTVSPDLVSAQRDNPFSFT